MMLLATYEYESASAASVDGASLAINATKSCAEWEAKRCCREILRFLITLITFEFLGAPAWRRGRTIVATYTSLNASVCASDVCDGPRTFQKKSANVINFNQAI